MARPAVVARTAVSLQCVFGGCVRQGNRLHYKVPCYQTADQSGLVIYRRADGRAWNGDFDCFVRDQRVYAGLSEDDIVGLGRFCGWPIRAALDDHGYAEWVRSVRAPSGQLAGVQALLLARDRRFNARVAWRRALWHARFFLALWWAAEQRAIASGRFAAPDVGAFWRDLGSVM